MRTCTRSWKVAAAAGIALAILASPAPGATTWKASIWGPSRPATQPFEWYAKEVAAKTGGQVRFVFAYGQGKPTDAVELIKSGAAEATYVCPQYHPDKMPLATVIDLPMFAPDNLLVLGRVELAFADHPAIQAELRKSNVKMLLPAPLAQYQLMGTRRVAKLDDLKGAKVRIAGEMGKILEEYGATTNVASPTDVVALLKSGAIDLAALPYPFGLAANKVQDASKYVTDKISLGTQLCFLGVSQKAWDALPANAQEVMSRLREPAVLQYEETYSRDAASDIALFKQKGLEFVAFNPVDRARLVAKAIKYWQAWVEEREKQGLKGKEVFEFTQAKIREFTRK